MGLLTNVSKCTVTRPDGEPCGRDSAPKMPWPCCGQHAIQLWRVMDKLAGGTSLARAR